MESDISISLSEQLYLGSSHTFYTLCPRTTNFVHHFTAIINCCRNHELDREFDRFLDLVHSAVPLRLCRIDFVLFFHEEVNLCHDGCVTLILFWLFSVP